MPVEWLIPGGGAVRRLPSPLPDPAAVGLDGTLIEGAPQPHGRPVAEASAGGPGGPVAVRVLHLWPHRSLPKRGFAVFMAISAAFVALPILYALGTPVLWFLLAPVALTFGLTFLGIQRSYRSGDLIEELRLTPGSVHLTRRDPDGRRRDWEANPYWVRVRMHERGGPVPNYLTLSGGPREVEIGAFLTAAERAALLPDLARALDDCRAL